MMINSLSVFIFHVLSITAGLYLTLNIRPTLKKIILNLLMIIPAIFIYQNLFSWLAILYFLIASIILFFRYTKNSRVFLDVPMLAIAGMIAENLSEIILYAFFIRVDLQSLSVKTLVFLLFFAIFISLYRLFIEKVWQTVFLTFISKLILTVIASVTVGVVYINLFIAVRQNLFTLAMFNLIIEMSYFVLMFVLSMILVRTVKKENQFKQKEIEHQQLLEYMESLEQINQDMQKFQHDYRNILLTMQDHINNNNLPVLKSFFNERIVQVEEQTLKNNYLYNQLDKLKLIELKGLITTKILVANQYDIVMNIEVPETIQTIDLDIIDLNRIIGILLDNAIEASTEIDNRELNIALIKKKDASVLIIIENRINKDLFNINRVFEENYTTKREHRGIGLATVREILTGRPNVTLNTRIEQNFFIHELSIEPLEQTNSLRIEEQYVSTRDFKSNEQKGVFS